MIVDGSAFLCAGGRDEADWVKNVAADAAVQLEIGGKVWSATATIREQAGDHPARRRLAERYQDVQPDDPLTRWAASCLLVEIRPAGGGDAASDQ